MQPVYSRARRFCTESNPPFPEPPPRLGPEGGETTRKMVGWIWYEIVRPSKPREAALATSSGPRPTHPTIPSPARCFPRCHGVSGRRGEATRKMVGWSRYEIERPSKPREAALATSSGPRPTHPTIPSPARCFPRCHGVSGRRGEATRKMVGWSRYEIGRPSNSREVALATSSGPRPTHPTIPSPGRCFPSRHEVSGEGAKRLEKWWVGFGTRLEGRRNQEKLPWRQVPGLDPPTLRSRVQPAVSRGATASRAEGGEASRKMVGWSRYKIGRPSKPREIALATSPGPRPTHPTIPSPARCFPQCHGVSGRRGRSDSKNGGLDLVQDWKAVETKRSCLGDKSRASTHPPYDPESNPLFPEPPRGLGRRGEATRKMVGWIWYEIGRPSKPREVALATSPGPRPTHPTIPSPARCFPRCHGVSGRRGETTRKMVGWIWYEIGRPSKPREVALATSPGPRPTHPTIPSPARCFPRCHGVSGRRGRSESKNGGLVSVQDWKAVETKRNCLGDKSRASTHPPYDPESSPLFPAVPRRLGPKGAKRVEKWWVGLGTRLEGRRNQEKLPWRQVPGLDPPTLRSRVQPAVSRSATASRAEGGEATRKMVGWIWYKIGRPSKPREVALATSPGPRPTHPTIPSPTRCFPSRHEVSGEGAKRLEKWWVGFGTRLEGR